MISLKIWKYCWTQNKYLERSAYCFTCLHVLTHLTISTIPRDRCYFLHSYYYFPNSKDKHICLICLHEITLIVWGWRRSPDILPSEPSCINITQNSPHGSLKGWRQKNNHPSAWKNKVTNLLKVEQWKHSLITQLTRKITWGGNSLSTFSEFSSNTMNAFSYFITILWSVRRGRKAIINQLMLLPCC